MKWVSDETLSYDKRYLVIRHYLGITNYLVIKEVKFVKETHPNLGVSWTLYPHFFCIYTYVSEIAQQTRLTLKISTPTYMHK